MTVAAYRLRSSGLYPVSVDGIRALSNAAFGDEPPQSVLDEAEAEPVEAVEPPAFDPTTHSLTEAVPVRAGLVWRQVWMVTPLTPRVVVVLPADLWRRATEEEAEKIEAAMAAQPARLRNLFRSASTYQSDDPLWTVLTGAATQLFGPDRAADLLAPSA